MGLISLVQLGSTASASAVVGAATITTVANPGIALHVSVDGRLDGNGFAVDISGYRFAYQVGYGSSAKNAAVGRALLVFGLTGSGTTANASLEIDGQGEPLPASTPSVSTPAYYLASVPEGAHDVALQVSANGFSQTFSFTTGHREGVQPAVLYRGQDQWEQVDNIGQVSYVNTPDEVDSQMYGRVEFTLTSATLTYFLPSTGASPASPSKAWVVLAGSAIPNNDAPATANNVSLMGLAYMKTLPASDLTLTIPGQTPMPAMLSGQGGADDESGANGADGGWGLFGGDYYWQVPAGIVSATLKVNLPAQLLAESEYNGSPLEVPVEGQVPPVHVGFAPPSALPPISRTNPPAWAASPGATQPVTAGGVGSPQGGSHSAASAVAGRGRSSVGGVVLLAIVVALLAVAVVAFLTRRRLVPALAGLVQSPAQRRAAEVEAFLPIPPASAVGGARSAPPPGAEPSDSEHLPQTSPLPSAKSPATPNRPIPPTLSSLSVLVAVPDGPAPLRQGAVELQLIGRVRLVGDVPAGASELSEPALEALAALALREGQPLTREELRALLGAGRDTERSAGTVSNYLANLRRVFGPERVPDASGAGGYRVVGIGTDFARFHELVRLAKTEPDRAARHLADALSLVRGAPFSGVPEHSYGWADRHDLGAITTKLVNSVHRAAVDLGGLAIDAGDGTLATWATEKGLIVWHEDEDLDELYLSAAAILADRSALARAWSAVKRPYESRSEEVPKRLVDHYQSLRRRAERLV